MGLCKQCNEIKSPVYMENGICQECKVINDFDAIKNMLVSHYNPLENYTVRTDKKDSFFIKNIHTNAHCHLSNKNNQLLLELYKENFSMEMFKDVNVEIKMDDGTNQDILNMSGGETFLGNYSNTMSLAYDESIEKKGSVSLGVITAIISLISLSLVTMIFFNN